VEDVLCNFKFAATKKKKSHKTNYILTQKMQNSAYNQIYNFQRQCLIAVLASYNSHNYYSCFGVSGSIKQIHCVI